MTAPSSWTWTWTVISTSSPSAGPSESLTVYENLAIGGGDIDLTPPVIDSVIALVDPTQVVVEFSEDLDPVTAEDSSNYAISHGVSVTDAALDTAGQTVTLTTSTLSEGTAIY